ncbi:MAG: acyl-CoA thioesterase [Cytophagales bacterium]|nr:acyl-CoA thioesterase [Rhizobacter sp.]
MRIEIPEDKRLVHEMRIAIRWGDMDAMGHVNNVSYFRYLETARIEWLNGAGFQPDPNGEGFVIINAFCNFLIQLEYPGEIIAKTYTANLGRSSFDSFTTMARADAPDVISAAGGATIVWVNFPQQKSMPFPERLRVLIG